MIGPRGRLIRPHGPPLWIRPYRGSRRTGPNNGSIDLAEQKIRLTLDATTVTFCKPQPHIIGKLNLPLTKIRFLKNLKFSLKFTFTFRLLFFHVLLPFPVDVSFSFYKNKSEKSGSVNVAFSLKPA